MATKPTVYPEWASLDQVDPISDSNNVIPPPPVKKLYGFARLEFPPRNWINWLFREIYLWIIWLDQQESQNVVVDGSGSTSIVDVVTGGLVTISVVSTDAGETGDYYEGILYIPPGYAGGLSFNTTSSNTITVSSVSATGKVTIGGGGTGPFIVSAKTSNIQ